jgi:hypothetical protein
MGEMYFLGVNNLRFTMLNQPTMDFLKLAKIGKLFLATISLIFITAVQEVNAQNAVIGEGMVECQEQIIFNLDNERAAISVNITGDYEAHYYFVDETRNKLVGNNTKVSSVSDLRKGYYTCSVVLIKPQGACSKIYRFSID